MYINLRGYLEFGATNHSEGGTMFRTVSLPVSTWAKAGAKK